MPPKNDILSFDEALIQDGIKLSQMTGQDHGPWFIEEDEASLLPAQEIRNNRGTI